jgi:hypothetical protein
MYQGVVNQTNSKDPLQGVTMKFWFPIYANTFDGAKVECWEWDRDTEQWVDTQGRHHDPEDLHSVEPPHDDQRGYYPIPCVLQAVAIDGTPIRVNGWQPFVPQWETEDGHHHPLINSPRPLLKQRYRSLDAPWSS